MIDSISLSRLRYNEDPYIPTSQCIHENSGNGSKVAKSIEEK